MTCVRCEVADAERASHVTGFAYVYTAAGFRPMAPGSDPFADAPLAEHEWDQESLRRAHARVAWCRARNQQPGPWAKEGERVYQRERHLRRKRAHAQRVHSPGAPLLTSPTGSPMLVSVAGQRDLNPDEATADNPDAVLQQRQTEPRELTA